MSDISAHLSPGQVYARRVKEARQRLGWTQQQLADRLSELGLPMDRTTIVKLEQGKRAQLAPVDKVFALAGALGVPPLHLLVPLEDEAEVAVTPKVSLPAPVARGWIRGTQVVPIVPEPAGLPRSDLRRLVWLAYTRGMSPLVLQLERDRIDAAVERYVEAIIEKVELREEAPVG
jgi:transcriptional regulator with XRE-family HTH domain